MPLRRRRLPRHYLLIAAADGPDYAAMSFAATLLVATPCLRAMIMLISWILRHAVAYLLRRHVIFAPLLCRCCSLYAMMSLLPPYFIFADAIFDANNSM